MNYFYVLQSKIDNSFYYGSTKDLIKRLEKHNGKMVKSTKSKIPYRVVYYEAYTTYALARRREEKIKRNWAAKEELKNRIM